MDHNERAEPALDEQYDVIVVGGGAAGLSAGLTLGRARRSALVVDAGSPRNAPAGHVHNYLAREGTPPLELLAAGRAEVAQYGGRVVSGTVVSAEVEGQDPAGFTVQLADGRSVRGRRLLVTTGLIDELPKVTGLEERFGRDVLHCPYCHGWEVRDQALGILAGSPVAVHQALMFRQWSDDITLFLNGRPEPSAEESEQLAARGIAVVPGEVEAVVVDDDRVTGLRLRSGEVIPRQAIVVGPRFAARAEVLSSLGLAVSEQEMGGQVIGTYVAADAFGATSVPGVWVAGNVADPRAQVISAAAAGVNVAAAINADLTAEETRQAVAAYRAR
jgi:thioredoxin reductase (NADPH)